MRRGEVWWAERGAPRGSEQVATIDKDVLVNRAGRMPSSLMAETDAGLRLVLEL